MHVIVIGAGVIGVSTAYYLNEAGCQVTVLERNSGVAQEASFGNAGVIAPGYVTPWAAPGMPGKILSYLFKAEAPVLFRPSLDPAMWRWVLRWLKECNLERYRINKTRMQRIALYSREQLHEVRARHDLQYEQTQGYLQLFRSERDADMAQPAMNLLKENGVVHERLDAAGCRIKEPGLADFAFSGGLYLPGDETGNCPLFTRHLKDLCARSGVNFEFGVLAGAIDARRDGVTVQAGERRFEADAVVVAGGVDSAALLKPLGLKIPLYPVKGYSATIPIKEPTYAPLAAVMDEAYKVAITRMGNRIRIAGTAELGSRNLIQREAPLRTLIKVARDWFPGAADYSRATWWTGARPMLPDGPPLLGATPVERVFLNLGHGSTGWAMAPGSGKVLADVITGRKPGIALDGLTYARYGQSSAH